MCVLSGLFFLKIFFLMLEGDLFYEEQIVELVFFSAFKEEKRKV